MPVLYLAGPIDLVGKDGQVWKKYLMDSLAKYPLPAIQLTAFDPAAPYGLFEEFTRHGVERAHYIERVNAFALRAADVFIALMPTKNASVGTPIELDLAKDNAKDIFVLSDMPYAKSVYVRNRVRETNYVQQQPDESLETWMERSAGIIIENLEAHSLKCIGPTNADEVDEPWTKKHGTMAD